MAKWNWQDELARKDAAIAEASKIIIDLMDALIDEREAFLGRELRERDIPGEYRKAERFLNEQAR